MTGTYLADLLRDIAACSNQPAAQRLLEIAAQVGRQEVALDELVGTAQIEDALTRAWRKGP